MIKIFKSISNRAVIQYQLIPQAFERQEINGVLQYRSASVVVVDTQMIYTPYTICACIAFKSSSSQT